MTRPPRLAVRWLERRLQPDERQELLGDLGEQFVQRATTDGVRAARRWYWRQTFALIWGFFLHRRDVVSTAHERTRGVWLLGNAASDWRCARRSLLSSRANTTIAIVTLTLGIGLSTSVFSLINGILLRPLPYPGASRLVRIAEARPARGPVAGPAVLEASGGAVSDVTIGVLIGESKLLDHVTPFRADGSNITTPRGTEQALTAEVGTSFFDLLGVRPTQGRLLQADDARKDAPQVAVVSDRFWRGVLDGRADVIGATIQVEKVIHTIVGVGPSDLAFPQPDVDVWIPGRWTWPAPGGRRTFSMWSQTIARLAPGATIEEASADARRIAQRIATADPAFFDGGDVQIPAIRVRPLQQDMVAPVRRALVALAVGVALVLLAVCANLANLLLARSTARQREVAVRIALGASRWRVMRPLLFEQIALASAGAALGGLLAWWLIRGLPALAPAALPRVADVRFDAVSLAFASLAALAIGLAVGLLPTYRLHGATLRDLSAGSLVTIGRQATSAESVRRALVVCQVALAVTLLVGAMLLGRSLLSLVRVNPGYQGEGALTFQVGLPEGIWQEGGRQAGFFAALLSRLAQNPDVVAAGATSTLPLNPVGLRGNFGIEGRPLPPPGERPIANKIAITPDYLRAVGTRVLRGRGFTDADTAQAELVVLVNEAVAREYFPDADPIGTRIEFARKLYRIIGVVESIKQQSVADSSQTVLYFAAPQLAPVMAYNKFTGGIAIRTTGDPVDAVPFIRSAVRAIDPTVSVFNAMRLDDRLSATFAEPRFYAVVVALFAALALTTSVLGVYGVLSYAVERRRAEFGLRRALGADERHVVALVLRQASMLVVGGLIAGLVVCAAGTGLLRSLLFGIEPLDLPTFAVSAILIVLVGLAAAWQPVRRALRVDPAHVLRAG